VMDPASLDELFDGSGVETVSLAQPARNTEKLSVKEVTNFRDKLSSYLGYLCNQLVA
jgi:hypothetical protein